MNTPIGTSKWDLDTPALCVDLDVFERNLAAMRTRMTAMNVACRPHAKSHKCPAIATRQLAGGSIGICTAKVSEAEVFSAHGIGPILMTTSNVTASKIRRAMAIRKTNPEFIQAVDYPQNARDRNDAAKAAGIVADVVIDVAIDYSRKTFFTRGVVKTNLNRLPWKDGLRFIPRAIVRKITV